MTQSKDPLPSLEALQRKIDKTKSEGGEDTPNTSNAQMGKAMHVATEMMAGVGVGGGIGYGLDYLLGTSPICFIVFFFLGFAAGVRNMMRSFNKGE